MKDPVRVGDKFTKEEANYRYSRNPAVMSCSICQHFQPDLASAVDARGDATLLPGWCSVVAGPVRGPDVSDLFILDEAAQAAQQRDAQARQDALADAAGTGDDPRQALPHL